jgi:CheY-like chemotaxis protein
MAANATTATHPLIAIANHDAILMRLLQNVLEGDGYRTLVLPQGSAGYDAVKTRRPDAILLDTWLANREEAWLLLQILRLDPETVHIPVLLTGSDGTEFEHRAELLEKNSGVEILGKPYDTPELLSKMQQLLSGE